MKLMIKEYNPETVLTSMPAFLNPRGIIWHTLRMMGAVMSKTDLHFIDCWDVANFCFVNNYEYQLVATIEKSWAGTQKMYSDLSKRIPLALKDASLTKIDQEKLEDFLMWVWKASKYMDYQGAVNVYRIDI